MEKKLLWMLKSVLAAYVITGVALMVLTFFVYQFQIDEELVNYVIMGIYAVSTFVGGFIVGKLTKKRKFLWGLVVGGFYIGALCGISYGVYGTVEMLEMDALKKVFLCLGGGMFGGMMS